MLDKPADEDDPSVQSDTDSDQEVLNFLSELKLFCILLNVVKGGGGCLAATASET